MPMDALRRFTPTPFQNSFKVHGATVSVATNCQLLADRLLGALVPSEDVESPPAFGWRVVVEPDDDLETDIECLSSHRLQLNGLALVTIGQKTFLAWDMQAHEGVSFLSKLFVDSEKLFQQYFLPTLISALKGLKESHGGVPA